MQTILSPITHKPCHGTGYREVCQSCSGGKLKECKEKHHHIETFGCTSTNFGSDTCGMTGTSSVTPLRTTPKKRMTRAERRMKKESK